MPRLWGGRQRAARTVLPPWNGGSCCILTSGGLSNNDGAESDVYATALATFALRENNYWTASSPGLKQARDYLAKTRREDGYWLQESRAAPVQRYFDNGDPGARDQFVTLFATAWAAIAMTE